MIGGVDNYYGNSHANGQINYGPITISMPPMVSLRTLFVSRIRIIGSSNRLCSITGKRICKLYCSWIGNILADPSFTISNINSLQNANKYPIVVGNCCITNHFNTTLCFGEAWLRASNKGAVIYIGGNNNTYWDEDYYWGVGYKPPAVSSGSPFIPNRTGTYDALFHTHDEPLEDWAASVGAMIIMEIWPSLNPIAPEQTIIGKSIRSWEILPPSLIWVFRMTIPPITRRPCSLA